MQSKGSASPISPPSPRFPRSALTSKSPLSAKGFRVKKKTFSEGLPKADVRGIQATLDDELQRTKLHPEYSKKESYIVHKLAFDQLVESKAAVYKSLLSQIKAEYEEFIDTLERGQNQTVFLQGTLKALLSERANVRHFAQRGDDLEGKLVKLRQHNSQLKQKLHAIKTERDRRLASAESKSILSVAKETRLLIPGLSLEDLTDLATLKKTSLRLEAQVRELKDATSIKFAEKGQKQLLKQQLLKKEDTRGSVFTYHEKLQERCETLKVAVEAAKSVVDNPDQDVHIVDVILRELENYGNSKYSKKSDPLQFYVSFDEDDPLKKKEAERLIEYADHFNDLFEFGQFELAAMHAANSPMGILRTYETMIKFKQAERKEGQVSPLLIFCDALMATASSTQPLTGAMSSECIRCALREGHLDLATHWLAQDRLTHSIPLGDAFRDYCKCQQNCSCTCIPLAQTVYMKVGAHHQTVACLCRQGKYSIMLNYAQKHAKFTTEDYRVTLLRNPSPKLANLMLNTSSSNGKIGILSFVSVVGAFLDHNQQEMLLSVLQHLSQTNSNNISVIMMDALFNETKSDNMTADRWLHVVNMCQEAGLLEMGIEILSILTIRDALNKASIAYSMDYIS